MTKPFSLATLPRKRPDLQDLPIPRDIAPGSGWSPLMIEMAAHIGAFAVLQLVERYGGLQLHVPPPAHENWFVGDVIGEEKAQILSRVFGGEKLRIPLGWSALEAARRGGVIAAVRARLMSLSEAAWLLRTDRQRIRYFANETDEGLGAPPSAAAIRLVRRARDRREPVRTNATETAGQLRLFDA